MLFGSGQNKNIDCWSIPNDKKYFKGNNNFPLYFSYLSVPLFWYFQSMSSYSFKTLTLTWRKQLLFIEENMASKYRFVNNSFFLNFHCYCHANKVMMQLKHLHFFWQTMENFYPLILWNQTSTKTNRWLCWKMARYWLNGP